MLTQKQILTFINEFSKHGPQVTTCFTSGNCYWFANILYHRFLQEVETADIVYDPLDNHFAVLLNGCYYDITGELCENYRWTSWHTYRFKTDPTHAKRIERQCINK